MYKPAYWFGFTGRTSGGGGSHTMSTTTRLSSTGNGRALPHPIPVHIPHSNHHLDCAICSLKHLAPSCSIRGGPGDAVPQATLPFFFVHGEGANIERMQFFVGVQNVNGACPGAFGVRCLGSGGLHDFTVVVQDQQSLVVADVVFLVVIFLKV